MEWRSSAWPLHRGGLSWPWASTKISSSGRRHWTPVRDASFRTTSCSKTGRPSSNHCWKGACEHTFDPRGALRRSHHPRAGAVAGTGCICAANRRRRRAPVADWVCRPCAGAADHAGHPNARPLVPGRASTRACRRAGVHGCRSRARRPRPRGKRRKTRSNWSRGCSTRATAGPRFRSALWVEPGNLDGLLDRIGSGRPSCCASRRLSRMRPSGWHLPSYPICVRSKMPRRSSCCAAPPMPRIAL